MDIKTLELDKILNIVKEYAISTKTKDRILNLEVICESSTINELLLQVEEFLNINNGVSPIPIGNYQDLTNIITRIKKGGVLNRHELMNIKNSLETVNSLKRFQVRINEENKKSDIYNSLVSPMVFDRDLNTKISDIIDERGLILDTASYNLRRIRQSLKKQESNVKNKMMELLQKYSDKLSDNIITLKSDRQALVVKRDYKNQIKGSILGESASGESVFIEPNEVVEIYNKINILKSEEENEIDKILLEITNDIEEVINEIELNFINILEVDFINAKALYANSINGVRPKLNSEGIVDLKKTRHPLIDSNEVVENDIIIKDYLGLVITGPNAGGKTVTLKTLGLSVLMTQTGMLIPCDTGSEIAIFDAVYADIGDEQSIEQNLSTFSSHMKNIIRVLDSVTTNTLVLFDEIGGGTDPDEGANLAIGIIDYLIKRNVTMIVTTHYPKLKAYAVENEKLENASVEFDIEELKATYKLLIGVPGQSKAFEISKSLGLNKDVIEFAKTIESVEDNYSSILEKLELKVRLLNTKLEDVSTKEKEISTIKSELKIREEEILIKEEKAKKLATKEATDIIRKAKEEVSIIMEGLKELKDKSLIKDHELSDIKSMVNNLNIEVEEKESKNTEPLSVGDVVNVISYNQSGVITKINKKKYIVKMGNLVLDVDRKKIEFIEKSKKVSPKINTDKKMRRRTPLELDLRGHRYEEAKIKLEKYIDDCLYSINPHARIIHGYGTGAIDKLVQGVINKNKYIVESRKGDYSEGGGGATIIYFRK